MAAGAALVARRAGAASVPRSSCARPPPPRCRLCSLRATQHASRSPPPGGAAASAVRRSPSFGGVVLDLTGSTGVGDGRCRVRASSRSLPGTFGPDLERELGDVHGLTVGHFPQSFDIATVGGWVACRGAGQYSTRYGKIEDMVVGLEVVLADGTRGPHRRRAGGGGRAPTSTSCSSGPRARSASSPGCGCGPTRSPPARTAGGVPLRPAVRRDRGVPADPPARRHAGGAAPLRRASSRSAGSGGDGTHVHAARARRGRRRDRRRDDARRRRRVHRVRRCRRRRARRRVAAAPQRHRRRCRRSTRKGFVVDTMEIAAPWSRLADGLRRRHAQRCWPCRTPVPRPATCRTATPTAPACTSRSPPPRRPTRSSRPTWRCGTPASGPCWRPAATCRTTTASGSTAPGSSREALGAGFDVLVGDQDGARSERHPQPRQARAAVAVRSTVVAVIDRHAGTSTRCAPAAMVALVFAVPFSIAARWAADSRNDGALALLALARRRRRLRARRRCARRGCSDATLPLTHGLVTAIGTYVAAQAVFIVVRLVRGDDVNWFAALFNLVGRRRRRADRRAARAGGCAPRGSARRARGSIDEPARHRRRHDRPARRGRRPDATPRSASSTAPFPPVDAVPRPGRVRRRRDGRARARAAHAVLDRGRRPAIDAVGITTQRASTVVWDRATGEPIGPGTRLAGPAHRRRVHHRQGRARPGPRPQPVGHQARLAARPTPAPGAIRRPVLRHRRHLGGLDAVAAARCTSPITPTPRSPGCYSVDAQRVERAACCAAARHRSGDAARRSSTRPAMIGEATGAARSPR